MTPVGGPPILVVEDEILLLEIVVQELRDAGYTVLEATSGEDAIRQMAAEQGLAALFTDIRLPGVLNGWDIAKYARRLRPELPVIYTTGYAPDEQQLVTESLLIRKPYRITAVLEALIAKGVPPRS